MYLPKIDKRFYRLGQKYFLNVNMCVYNCFSPGIKVIEMPRVVNNKNNGILFSSDEYKIISPTVDKDVHNSYAEVIVTNIKCENTNVVLK